MKIHFALISLIFILISCDKKNNEKNGFNHTYESKRDSLLVSKNIEIQNTLKLPSILNWENAIRIRCRTSWGNYDYICSIYDEEKPRIQLIRQNMYWQREQEQLGYIVKEKFIEKKEYNDILNLIDKNGLKEMPRRPEENIHVMDGSEFSFLIKNRNDIKVMTWERFEENNKRKPKIMEVFNKILFLSDYPTPRLIIGEENKNSDSSSYLLWLEENTIVKDFEVKYKGQKISKNNRETYKIEIPINEVDTIKRNLKIKLKLKNGKISIITEEQIKEIK
jgi:hypothetical protein